MLDRTSFGRRLEPDAPAPTATRSLPLTDSFSNRSPTNDDGKVGGRIKKIRRNQGLTQKDVAGRVGVTGAQFHRYETGTTRIAASRLIAIATVLGIRPEVLMNDNSVQPSKPPAAGNAEATNDLVELVELFSTIEDERRRSAVLTFARSIATPAPAPQDKLRPGSLLNPASRAG